MLLKCLLEGIKIMRQSNTQTDEKLILRGYWRSSATWRVRIALHYKEIPFEYRPVHLVRNGGEQHSPEELKRNPFAQVPTLELDDGTILTQSLAIIDYIESLKSTPSIYPHSSIEKAQALQLAEMINSGIQPLQNLSLLIRVNELGADKIQWGHDYIKKGLSALEYVANQTNQSRCLIGDTPTVADFCLIPQLYNARRFKVDLSEMSRLCAVETHCQGIKAFQMAAPDAQIDAQ
jgi:maleylpyruvate isomerase